MIKKYLKENPLIIICVGFIVLVIFSYMFVFVESPIGIIAEKNQGEWLQWLGSILSGVIGGAFTYLGVKITLDKDNERRMFENKKNALPLLKVSESEYDYRWEYIQFDFNFTEESRLRERKDIGGTPTITINIKNVGQRELYELYLGDFSSTYFDTADLSHPLTPIVYKDDSLNVNFVIYEKGSYDDDLREDKYHTLISPFSFNVYFKDCYENWYFQTIDMMLFHQIKQNTPAEECALGVSISNIKIASFPTEIEENKLPWKIKGNICGHL